MSAQEKTGYRFGPTNVGSVHNCFRTYEDAEEFLLLQLEPGQKAVIYKVTGTLVADDGGRDGLKIKVTKKEEWKTVVGK